MLRYAISALALLAMLALLPIAAVAESITLSNVLYDGPVTSEYVSAKGLLDWPKVMPGINATSYDWWYFDIVSADTASSATVVFYNSGPNGFIIPYPGGPLSVSLIGRLPNGTVYTAQAPATSAIVTRDDSSFATSIIYENTGFSFNGTSQRDGKINYVITIDAPELGVTGTITLDAVAPAHYPCGPDKSGQTELILPHVGWSNAIPDAAGTADLLINGTAVKFTGPAYHDKNWGDMSFAAVTSAWYWGHASLGPYSIVWFDAFDKAGVEYFSGYVAKDGKVLLGSCGANAVVVRPWGANSEFPPKMGTGIMQGVEMTFDLGHGKTFWANVTTTATVIDIGVYVRTLGTVTGGLNGCKKEETYHGASLFEEFKFTP